MTGNKQVGEVIKKLRRDRNITGSELGRLAAMSQSKISKIENGLYPVLQLQEIERILNILDASNAVRRQIYRAIEANTPASARFKPYNINYAVDVYETDRATKDFRIFTPAIVPALLQTNDYRLALLRSWGTEEEDSQILQRLAKRQELLWDKHRSFHFIMHQTVLYGSMPGERGLGLAQLDRIERFIGVPNIKVGIIPFEAGLPLVETGPFALLDERMVWLGTVNGDLMTTNNIAAYLQLFADLSHSALYGADVRRLLKNAAALYR